MSGQLPRCPLNFNIVLTQHHDMSEKLFCTLILEPDGWFARYALSLWEHYRRIAVTCQIICYTVVRRVRLYLSLLIPSIYKPAFSHYH